ncbi:uncharacterized protein LOC110010387 [Jatropha curcas]|uniref:uncharacterized protein LOC110010387 n=1 Tax=Jatropha curcas TaxID=180498 RepID=UPI00189598BC|nr:uncharacterized protein LOC110010387 [Jatropha curcas]
MASCPQKSQNQTINPSMEGDMVGLIINQLHKQFHGSLDLNYPILSSTSQPPLQSKLCFDREVKCPIRESKKRALKEMEMEIGEEEEKKNDDLKLRLSPPGMKPKDESSNQLLVLMGCSHCFIYVMVSQTDPKCPNCKSPILIDVFKQGIAKRTKRC